MFQWDAVDTSPDQGDQNVLKTVQMAIRHDMRTTRTELYSDFCRWIYFHLRSKIFFWSSYAAVAPSYGPAAGIASAAAAASEAITTTGQCKDGRVLKADLGGVM